MAATIALLGSATTAFENNAYYLSSFLDLTKAFDIVSHEILIRKLFSYNFHPSSTRLILSYLSNRFQTVKVNESMYFSKPNGLTTWGGVYKGFLNSYGETRPSNQQELRYWDLLKHSLDKDISTSKSYFQNIR